MARTFSQKGAVARDKASLSSKRKKAERRKVRSRKAGVLKTDHASGDGVTASPYTVEDYMAKAGVGEGWVVLQQKYQLGLCTMP